VALPSQPHHRNRWPLITAFGLANYFPKYKMTIIMLFGGIFDASVGATAIWIDLYDMGIVKGINKMAPSFIGVIGLFWFRTFVILPVKNPEEEKSEKNAETVAILDEKGKKKLSGINLFVSKLSLLKNKSVILFLSSSLILKEVVVIFDDFPR
jgi:hypothetical protein